MVNADVHPADDLPVAQSLSDQSGGARRPCQPRAPSRADGLISPRPGEQPGLPRTRLCDTIVIGASPDGPFKVNICHQAWHQGRYSP